MAIDKVAGTAWADLSKISDVAKAGIAKVAGQDVPASGPAPFFNLDAQESTSYSGSGTTWTDIAGGNNVTLRNGPVFTNNQSTSGTPSYFTWDGVDDYADDGTSLTGWDSTDSWTFEFWFSMTARLSSTGYIYTIYTKGNSNSTPGVSMGMRGGAPYYGTLFRFSTTGGYNEAYPSSNIISSINDGNWHQFIFTKDAGSGTTPKFYMDGSNVSLTTMQGGSTPKTLDKNYNNTDTLYISNYRGTGNYEFNGKLAAIRWYGSYFDATQALNNYNAQKGAYGIT